MDIFLFVISLFLLFAILLSYTPFHGFIFEKRITEKKKSNREVRIDNENITPLSKIVPKFQAAKPDNISKLSDSVPWFPEGKPKKNLKYKIYVHKNGSSIENKKYNKNSKEKEYKIFEKNPSKLKKIEILKISK
ncbi:Hypothetical protein SRAE_2000004000 [Strongyloides ratti]|uniref:Uncharacterized protein n=1 Tax=Strongyloides ratti TaxID=34506 RepID=A0A090MXF8_STRRB|nr:Hypothetical protein SRAE_2000004000 [Strongyloides ratti]CEF65359.1 Hypothetical protein SRAE_2000004000 [Strongyloides ratti]